MNDDTVDSAALNGKQGMATPKRLTPEESANAWAQGQLMSAELWQQTSKMRLPTKRQHTSVNAQHLMQEIEQLKQLVEIGLQQTEELRFRLAASDAMVLTTLDKCKKLQTQVDDNEALGGHKNGMPKL